jgi:hypothetical protein
MTHTPQLLTIIEECVEGLALERNQPFRTVFTVPSLMAKKVYFRDKSPLNLIRSTGVG